MSDPNRASALQGHLAAGRHGAAFTDDAPVSIGEVRLADLVMVNGGATTGPLPGGLGDAPSVGETRSSGAIRLLCLGPGQWLVGDREAGGLRRRLEDMLGSGDATVTDLGQARTVIRIAGASACEVLAKGCPLDIDGMRHDACAATVLGPFNAVIDALGEAQFDVYVFRSFGQALLEWLRHEAAEFGYTLRVDAAAED